MSLKEKVKELAKQNVQDVISIRRHLHANPELSYQEFNTAKYVAAQLKEMGITPKEGIAGTGLAAVIEGKNPSKKVIALRADMDALPIKEANDIDYKSQNEGVMHACGHDAHTASLLGVAKILTQLKDEFEGSVKLIFQPGEEKNPGGASLMIKDGVLKDPAPVNIHGQHVMPLIPVGKVGFREGMYMASCDEIYLKVIGKGGHGAVPELAVDPVLITSHIIVALQQVISRNASPKTPTVLTFGKVIADGATNIIPNEVNVEGTFRAMDETWRADAHEKIIKMASGIAESMGGSCEVEISKGYPYLENDPELTKKSRTAAEEYLGEENVVDLDLWMGAEDFSFYTHEIPACFYRLGTRNEAKGITSYVHTPTFNIDEDALEIGAGLMAWLALKELAE
ncbi:M20 family metallopeptidase [Fulvivirga maritima]|uniref:M20 metallopeptidase family protein n=1 Tax=Fulvivirga maritima TaxID=2904247 RepID=UPI001F3D7F0D|nr:M20 family metallopeptidase [Fulvivirga maritima]UII27831.1 M20 family metallopeptidase [Fulvivirga maritima]